MLVILPFSVVWIINPCKFFVRSKCYTFLKTLGCYKTIEHTVQFFFGHLVDFQDQNILTSRSTVSEKLIFSNCNILYINRKIIEHWSFFIKRLGCLLLLFSKNDDVITCIVVPRSFLLKYGIIYQPEDKFVLTIFYLKTWVFTAFVLKLRSVMSFDLKLEIGNLNFMHD